MTKRTIALVTLLAAAITGFSAIGLADESGAGNLLPNPGFEEKGKAWTWAFWSGQGTRGTHKWTEDAHSGDLAIEINGLEKSETGEDPRGLFYSLPVKCSPGIYEISGYSKSTDGMDGWVQIQTYDTDDPAGLIRKKANKRPYQHHVKASPDWRPFRRQFSFGDECKHVIVMLRGSGMGTVCFDDVVFRELDEPILAFLFPGRRAYGEDRAYIIERNVAPVVFGLCGDSSRLAAPLSLEIEVPAAVTLHSIRPLREVEASAAARRYVIELTERDIKRLRKTIGHDGWLTLWAEVNEPLAESQLRWRVFSDTSDYPRQSARLIVLPAVHEGQYARNFDVHFQWGLYGHVPEALWERVYQLYRACGINCFLTYNRPAPGTWDAYCVKRFREDGGTITLNASPGWQRCNETFPRDFGEGWLFKIATGGADTFEKLDNGHSAGLADEVDGFLWDAEFKPHRLCYDELTLSGFAEYMGLDRALVTEESVKAEYHDAYHAYCVDHLPSEVLKGWAAYMKKLKPDALLIAQQGAGVDGRYSDIAYYDIEGITHAPMTYTSSARSWADMIEQSSDYALQPMMPTTTTGLVRDSGSFASRSPESIRLDILTAASLGEPGICFWPDLNRQMGTYYMWQMARASADIRSVEAFFAKGNRIDQKVTVEGLPESESEIVIKGKRHVIRYPEWRDHLRYRAFQIQKERLVTVLNMSADKTAFVRIAAKINWPQDGFKVYDTVSGTRFVSSPDDDTWNADQLKEGVLVEVPPSDAVFLRIGRDETRLPEQTVCVQDTLSAYEQLREQSKATGHGGELREENLKMTWDDIDHDGSLEVLMVSPVQKVWITSSGGRLWAWKTGEKDLIRQGDGAGGCMDLFWLPEGARWQTSPTATYRVVQRGIEDGKAFVTLEHRVSTAQVPGLVIAKTYSMDESSSDVTVSLKITSESPEPLLEFAYWSHSAFSLGDSDKLVYETDKGTFIQEKTGRSLFAHRADLPQDMTGFASEPNLEPIAGNWLATWDEQTKEAVTVTLDKDALLQIYKWASGDKHTLEWMYQPVGLRSFESWNTKFVLSYEESQQMNGSH